MEEQELKRLENEAASAVVEYIFARAKYLGEQPTKEQVLESSGELLGHLILAVKRCVDEHTSRLAQTAT